MGSRVIDGSTSIFVTMSYLASLGCDGESGESCTTCVLYVLGMVDFDEVKTSSRFNMIVQVYAKVYLSCPTSSCLKFSSDLSSISMAWTEVFILAYRAQERASSSFSTAFGEGLP